MCWPIGSQSFHHLDGAGTLGSQTDIVADEEFSSHDEMLSGDLGEPEATIRVESQQFHRPKCSQQNQGSPSLQSHFLPKLVKCQRHPSQAVKNLKMSDGRR